MDMFDVIVYAIVSLVSYHLGWQDHRKRMIDTAKRFRKQEGG